MLSSSEVRNAIHELLNTKSKFLFFSINSFFGSVDGREFSLRAHTGDRLGMFLMAPKIKGSIVGENPTTVALTIVIPYFLIFFYGIFGVAFISLAFVNEMNINGVAREPNLFERLGFVSAGLVFPLIAFYYTTLRPIRLLEARVKEKLLLVRIVKS